MANKRQLVVLFVRTRAELEARLGCVATLGAGSAIWVFLRKGTAGRWRRCVEQSRGLGSPSFRMKTSSLENW